MFRITIRIQELRSDPDRTDLHENCLRGVFRAEDRQRCPDIKTTLAYGLSADRGRRH